MKLLADKLKRECEFQWVTKDEEVWENYKKNHEVKNFKFPNSEKKSEFKHMIGDIVST